MESLVLFYLLVAGVALIAAAWAAGLLLVAAISQIWHSPQARQWLRWFFGLGEVARPAPKLTVSLIIPAYNEEATLRETIRSVKAQTYPLVQVIVIDDCSQDRTSQIALEENVTVLRTPGNSGSKARAQIDSDILVTIDADTLLAPDAVEKLMSAFHEKKVAAACGFVIPQRISSIWERGRFIEYLYGITVHKGSQSNFKSVLVASGCFCAFRTDLLKVYGGFPLRTMAEDMDITWQFLEAGFEVKFIAEAFCYPLDPHDYTTFRKQVERWYRSYLQNISAHRSTLWRNKRLTFFVYWYLLYGMLMPLLLLGSAMLLIWSRQGQGLVFVIALELATVTLICSVQGIRQERLTAVLGSVLPYYFVLKPVNVYLFWRSLWLEWVRRERLSWWDKGH
ncbi:glycosyltransferase family 2 protein [Candidatus Acetothermia bacterium]|nr:glycosyltransferase family 2 protein [Candidatus Acetothermia bacterium]